MSEPEADLSKRASLTDEEEAESTLRRRKGEGDGQPVEVNTEEKHSCSIILDISRKKYLQVPLFTF